MEQFYTIGLMSGTSLDGLDIAYCKFLRQENKWSFELIASKTIHYKNELVEKLKNCINFSKNELSALDEELGHFFGTETKKFINENVDELLLVASHGHTVFHQPAKGITLQIGNGKIIRELVEVTTINNFRMKDVQLGGQGAPLVPIGDVLLFSEYNYCLNLGGIANISFDVNGVRKAFDICSCNLVLNYLSQQLGFEFDKGGELSAKGKINKDLYNTLLANPYYRIKQAKSLGKEDVWGFDIQQIDEFDCAIEDKLRTFIEVIAFQIAHLISEGNVLITGGGAYNSFLIERIKALNSNLNIELPSQKIIEFKEAIIFAFLGLLRYLGETNVLSSVTGASEDSCSGDIY